MVAMRESQNGQEKIVKEKSSSAVFYLPTLLATLFFNIPFPKLSGPGCQGWSCRKVSVMFNRIMQLFLHEFTLLSP